MNIHQVRWPTSKPKRSQNENTDGMCLFTGKSCRDNRALLGAQVICIRRPRNRQLRDPAARSDSGGIRPAFRVHAVSALKFGNSGADGGCCGASSRKERAQVMKKNSELRPVAEEPRAMDIPPTKEEHGQGNNLGNKTAAQSAQKEQPIRPGAGGSCDDDYCWP